jgi:hypothetical protein
VLRRQLAFLLPVPLLALTGLLVPLRSDGAPPSPGEVAYRSMPDKPAGDPDRTAAGLERTAIALAAWLRAVPLAESDDTPCPTERLQVSWDAPDGRGHHGAYVGPLGPEPSATTRSVNGIVICRDAPWAFMGFQARWKAGRWDVVAVPVLDAETHVQEVTMPEPEAPGHRPAPTVSLDGRTFAAGIEGLAAYEPQRTCDATAKPGTTALRNLLLRDNPGSRNLGIVRGCSIGGRSEHKEGRAFDWGVHVGRPSERAQADAFVAKLLATDEHGNRYALARRMGVMYVIWNQRMWASYRADAGWQPYHGASPHTDHVHLSLSWAGAQARTSFWSGNVVDVLLASPPRSPSAAPAPAAPRPTRTVRRTQTIVATEPSTPAPTTDADPQPRRLSRRERRRLEHEAWAATTTTTVRRATTTSTTIKRPTTTTTSTTIKKPTTTTTSTTVKSTTTTTSTTVKPTTTTTSTTVKPTTTTTTAPPTTTTTEPTATTTTVAQ